MKRTIVVAFLMVVLLSPSLASGEELVQKCKRLLELKFPNTNWSEIRPSPIPGICEAATGSNVLYVYPGEKPDDKPFLLFGALYTLDGTDLTALRRTQLREEIVTKVFESKVKAKPILIGTGNPRYIEFVDPFCVHCRRAEKEIREVPRFLFFYPLSQRSEAVAAAVLCSENPRAEWEKVVAGKYDKDVVTVPRRCIDLVEEHKRLGRYLGVRGTPTIFDRQGRALSPSLIASKKQNKRR